MLLVNTLTAKILQWKKLLWLNCQVRKGRRWLARTWSKVMLLPKNSLCKHPHCTQLSRQYGTLLNLKEKGKEFEFKMRITSPLLRAAEVKTIPWLQLPPGQCQLLSLLKAISTDLHLFSFAAWTVLSTSLSISSVLHAVSFLSSGCPRSTSHSLLEGLKCWLIKKDSWNNWNNFLVAWRHLRCAGSNSSLGLLQHQKLCVLGPFKTATQL